MSLLKDSLRAQIAKKRAEARKLMLSNKDNNEKRCSGTCVFLKTTILGKLSIASILLLEDETDEDMEDEEDEEEQMSDSTESESEEEDEDEDLDVLKDSKKRVSIQPDSSKRGT